MNMLLVTAVFALGGDAQPTAAKEAAGARLDGKYMIVYAEEGGRRNNAWEQRQATIKDNTLSYEPESGKQRSLQLKLGKHQTLEATSGAKTRHGVYILGRDYLCVSLGAATAANGSSGSFILILRRQRGAKAGAE
jgi:hypothetical protein